MKKWIAVALFAAMMLAVCGIALADLPEPTQHFTFDNEENEGYIPVVRVDDVGDNDGANYGIAPAEEGAALFRYGEGPVGKALFLDGKFGLDLGFQPTNTDTWTVSYWMNASRLSDYGPTLQIGYNMGKSDANANVTWMNVTQTNWTPKYFPTVWSRNVASNAEDGTACWPWMAPFSDEGAMIGKREWAMFTIVCSGEEQTGGNGQKTVGAQLYVNGQLAYDSADNYENGTYFTYTWDATLAPNIMKPDEGVPFEAYFGINYWDTIYKGYVDDLYVFDTALNAEQVAELFAKGNPAIESPQNGPVEETAEEAAAEPAPVEEAAPAVEVAIKGTAVGAEDFSTGWWGAHSDIWAVPAGEKTAVYFTNYNKGEEASNWNNFVIVLQNTPEGHSAETEGYAEYAVVRSDNYGWGPGYDGNDAKVLDNNWDWDNYCAKLNGANVLAIVENDGATADVLIIAKNPAGETYYQLYKGIITGGDLYFCLGVDSSCLDVLAVLDNAAIEAALAGEAAEAETVAEEVTETVAEEIAEEIAAVEEVAEEVTEAAAEAAPAVKATLNAEPFDWGEAITHIIVTFDEAPAEITDIKVEVTATYMDYSIYQNVTATLERVPESWTLEGNTLLIKLPFEAMDPASTAYGNAPEIYNVVVNGQTITDLTLVDPAIDAFLACDNGTCHYRLFVPETDAEKVPMVVWLHGAGEQGADNRAQIAANLVTNWATPESQAHFGGACYIMAPQAQGPHNVEAEMQAILEVLEQYPNIDKDRIYVGGCSMGGGGTMNMINTYPEFFAAAFPICPAGSITDEAAAAFAANGMPVYLIHSIDDGTVNVSASTSTFEQLTAAGATVYCTLFDHVDTIGVPAEIDAMLGHWSWTYVHRNFDAKGEDEDGENFHAGEYVDIGVATNTLYNGEPFDYGKLNEGYSWMDQSTWTTYDGEAFNAELLTTEEVPYEYHAVSVRPEELGYETFFDWLAAQHK